MATVGCPKPEPRARSPARRPGSRARTAGDDAPHRVGSAVEDAIVLPARRGGGAGAFRMCQGLVRPRDAGHRAAPRHAGGCREPGRCASRRRERDLRSPSSRRSCLGRRLRASARRGLGHRTMPDRRRRMRCARDRRLRLHRELRSNLRELRQTLRDRMRTLRCQVRSGRVGLQRRMHVAVHSLPGQVHRARGPMLHRLHYEGKVPGELNRLSGSRSDRGSRLRRRARRSVAGISGRLPSRAAPAPSR